ncbi:MAG: hypothetical protein ACK5JJ_10800 [Cyanobacteriota bacterium]
MRLLSVSLRHVRQHRQLDLRFDPRRTLIGGANESGKSTLVEALHKGLFLKANASGRGVEELRSRRHAGLPEVAIEFEAAGRQWRLRKRFAGASGTCQLSDGHDVALSGPAAEEHLAGLLGMEKLVEGRRIGQLPERWAHLWVRQGDAGANLFEGPAESYDLTRLVEQLQRRGSGSALESPLDRQVIEQLRQRLEPLFTATGRVRAGSPLALARQREETAHEELEKARQRQRDLEQAMEELREIGERLETIERLERPALERQRQRQDERRPLQAEAEQQRQRLEGLRQVCRQLDDLEAQIERQRQEQQQQQARAGAQRQELGTLEQQLQSRQERRRQLTTEQQHRQQALEQLQWQLDLHQLEREARQLAEHRQQFERLQQQATGVKQALAALAPISPAEVNALRTAEQEWLQAETRLQAMATAVQLLESDQPVRLEGRPLAPGESRQLADGALLEVGSGVRLRISPGGGEAVGDARRRRDLCRQRLVELLTTLGVENSAAAEAIASRRQGLEAELANLRQAATTIPWARLEQQIAALAPRRQRLQEALAATPSATASATSSASATADSFPEPAPGPEQLEGELERLRHEERGQREEQERLEAELQGLERRRRQGLETLEREQALLQQLSGSSQTLEQRRQALEESHGRRIDLTVQLAEAQASLEARQQALAALQADQPEASLEQQQRRLEQEKEQLLSRRGQNEERCLSLGSGDPAAEQEQRLVAWEQARAERRAEEEQAEALQLLARLFEEMRSDLSHRYSEPLAEAITSYLQDLDLPGWATDQQGSFFLPTLNFDPRQGFADLRLREGEESFAFEQLSGGMREQLSGALRLAIAEVLKPAYDDVLPLIFDDAFTASDPERLEGVRRMIRRGSERGTQIILLSCTPADYAELVAAMGSRLDLPAVHASSA